MIVLGYLLFFSAMVSTRSSVSVMVNPLPTSKLARQADNLRAHLSVFPNGHCGPSGDRLLAEMELELLKRGTE